MGYMDDDFWCPTCQKTVPTFIGSGQSVSECSECSDKRAKKAKAAELDPLKALPIEERVGLLEEKMYEMINRMLDACRNRLY